MQQLAYGGALLYETSQFDTSGAKVSPGDGALAAVTSQPLSRLNSVFITFCNTLNETDIKAGVQYVNTYRGYPSSRESFKGSLQIGSSQYPLRPVHGYGEAYFRLLRTLGLVGSMAHTLGISMDGF